MTPTAPTIHIATVTSAVMISAMEFRPVLGIPSLFTLYP